jgi:hypothetical protein
MLTIEATGIRVDDLVIPWDVLREGGIYPTGTVTYYASAHPEVLERAVWAVWRAHITGNSVKSGLER